MDNQILSQENITTNPPTWQHPVLPGNCPGAGYALVSKSSFVESPQSADQFEWALNAGGGVSEDTVKELIAVEKERAEEAEADLEVNKQETLVSGTNIKTINGNSLLGSGNIVIQGGEGGTVDSEMSDTSENAVQNKVIKSYVDTEVSNKVDKDGNKVLSTNDYTAADKAKVDLINSTESLVFTLADGTTQTIKVVTGV